MTVNSPIHFAQRSNHADIDHNQQTWHEECAVGGGGRSVTMTVLRHGNRLLDSV